MTVVTTHSKKPQDSFWWTWGQFFGSDSGLCPLARTIPLPTRVTAFLLHAMSLSHGCTEADACSKSSWASLNSLSGSCCSLHVAGLRQEMVSVEIGLKPLSLSWLLPSGALLASCWFRRQSFPYKSAVLRNKWLTRKTAARVFEKPSLSPAIHHPSKPSALHSGKVENPQSC